VAAKKANSTPSDEEGSLPREGDVIAGKYRVDGVVGRGGMGVVLSAEHIQLKQQVALKILLLQGLDEARRKDARARFVKEGQAAARLTSDHVVRIFDVGTLDDGVPFLVMELLRGDDLATVIRRQGAAPVEVALDYVAQACDAIGEAHALGIVHRDLKPSNLFVCRKNDGRALIKVLDFGISKVIQSEDDPFEGNLTATRAMVGSPLYMSPEQLRNAKRVDPRTDVWSLGMILYELLTGGPAFEADSLLGLTAAVAADPPVPPRVRRPDISEALDALVLRCLEKEPAKRFQSISGLLEAILPLLPRAGGETSAEYASRRLESVLEAAAERAYRDNPTFRVPELQIPPSGLGGEPPFADTAASVLEGIQPEGARPYPPPPMAAAPRSAEPPPRSPPRLETSDAGVDRATTLVSSTGATARPPSEKPKPPAETPAGKARGHDLLWLALAAFVLGALAWALWPSGGSSSDAATAVPSSAPPRSVAPVLPIPEGRRSAPEIASALPSASAPPLASRGPQKRLPPGTGKKPPAPPVSSTKPKPSVPDILLER
jgi:serine/threonine protein kinase